MFKKLHLQLTFFCTLITSIILIAMSCAYLYIAESGLIKNGYSTFLNDLNSILSYLESQTIISHQWLSKTEGNGRFIIDLADNGSPLFYNSLNTGEDRAGLISSAKNIAARDYLFDWKSVNISSVLSQHTEFQMTDLSGTEYYVSAATVPKKNAMLNAIIIFSLKQQYTQIIRQRWLFCIIDFIAIILLGVFSLRFTKHVTHPIEENRKKQVEFVASASHELRTPLAVMLSGISAMKKADKEDADRFAQVIESEGGRMSRLIDDMLSLASADNQTWSIHLEPADMDTLLLDAYEKYEKIAKEKEIALTVQVPDAKLHQCRCDKERIAQVFSILIDNALSYTPKGGSVFLILSESENKLELRVQDNGPGIPNSIKDHIFERFYRADSAHKDKEHFGLGLSIASEIIRLHKGKIKIEDSPGGGAAFIITLASI